MRLNREEAIKYLRMQGAGADQRAALEETAALLEESLAPRYVYQAFDVEMTPGGAYLPQADLLLPGEMASQMLKECGRAALLLCTLGAAFDALLRSWEQRDMARAVMLDACGSAYVEAGCGAAEAEIASRHPLRVVFRDSSFASSPERINVEEIFKLLSPNTSVKVL